ncbi:tail fiber domain-containing protein [Anaerostipes faecalis]|uniref:tail fiber domain-containing protein n=1 Tax=Anaerostipes faecalis TaxID=2738446 RepID=UPI003EFBF344
MGNLIAYGELTITNLIEPFTVILSNESQLFTTNASRVATVAQSYYTDIVVYQGGTKRTDYTIGTITSANGITVSKNTSRVTFAVSANTTITADSGIFTIPITLDGKTISKTFSWSCAKQGANGATGSAAKAIDITATSQIFKSTDGGLTFSPDTVKLTPVLQGGLTFSKWQYSTNGGTSWTDVTSGSHGLTISSGVLTISKSSDLFTSSITTISFKCVSNNTTYFDVMTIVKLYDVTDIQEDIKDLSDKILENKTEINNVSLVVDKQAKEIESKISTDVFNSKMTIVQNDLSKANNGLNKWILEIYPKSLFQAADQSKCTIDVFVSNKSLLPSQTLLVEDSKVNTSLNCGDNYIGYGLTFAYFDAAYTLSTTWLHDDGGSLYLNGSLINSSASYISTPQSVSMSFKAGWNCIEVVWNGGTRGDGFKFGTALSGLSQCKLMNCYYGSITSRESQIINKYVDLKLDADGIKTRVSNTETSIKDQNGKITTLGNQYSALEQNLSGFKTTVSNTYTTKDEFNGLEIGGRNLQLGSREWDSTAFYSQGDASISGEELTVKNGSTSVETHSISVKQNEVYTVSFDVKCNTSISNANTALIEFYNSSNVRTTYSWITANVTTAWQRIVCTFTVTDSAAVNMRIGLRSTITSPYVNTYRLLKIEKGNKATDWTPAPEDVDGKIINVETIANQTANKFEWIVNGGDSSSNMTLTEDFMSIVAKNINLTGKVTFNSFTQDLKNTLNNKANVSYFNLSSGGNTQLHWKVATLKINKNYCNKEIVIGVNHRAYGYIECRILFNNSDKTDPGLASFRQTGNPTKGWQIIRTASGTWDLYLRKAEAYDSGNVTKYINPYDDDGGGNITVTWSGANADLPSGTTPANQMIADQTTIDGGIITTGFISADRIASGSISADKIDVLNLFAQDIIGAGSIRSNNYAESNGVATAGSKWILNDGSFKSKNLSWDANGNLTAKGGYIGKYKITEQSLITGSGSTATGFGGNQAFWAGSESSNSAPFRVGYDGKFTSTNADIAGKITATAGKIGSFNIDNALYTNTNSFGTNDDNIYIGSNGISLGTAFKVTSNGALTANNVNLTGTFTANSGMVDDATGETVEFNTNVGSKGIILERKSDKSKYTSIDNSSIIIDGGNVDLTIANIYFSPRLQLKYAINGAAYSTNITYSSITLSQNGNENIFAQSDGTIGALRYVFTDDKTASNYITCGEYNNTFNNYYYASGYHAFYCDGTGIAYVNSEGISMGGYDIKFNLGNGIKYGSNEWILRPYTSGDYNVTALGNGNRRTVLYGSQVRLSSATGTVVSSDRRLKKDFADFDERYDKFYMNLKPQTYRMAYTKNSEEYKITNGFIAQDVEDALCNADINPAELDLISCETADKDFLNEMFEGNPPDIEKQYSLNYSGFIALNTYMIQKTRKESEDTKQEIIDLKKKNAELKETLNKIMQKLNM